MTGGLHRQLQPLASPTTPATYSGCASSCRYTGRCELSSHATGAPLGAVGADVRLQCCNVVHLHRVTAAVVELLSFGIGDVTHTHKLFHYLLCHQHRIGG